MIDCHHYQKGDCRSCQWLEMPYEQQLAKKEEHLKQQLAKLDCDNLICIRLFIPPRLPFVIKRKWW